MRLIILISLLTLGAGGAGTKNAAMQQDNLNGTWIPVSQEFGGKMLPESVFGKEKLIISDSTYTVIAESVDKGTVQRNGNKMDIYGKDGVNAGKHFMAIYKYENEQLTICYNLKGDSYPEAFDTKDKPLFFLSVFKKEMK
jgi:uncharacterized protein (TIGR03067 family)